jgi:DnaK suppressor protein
VVSELGAPLLTKVTIQSKMKIAVGQSKAEDSRLTNMTKIELNGLRNALENKQAELENGNRSRGALVIETSPDELDRIQHGQERDLAIDILDRNSKLLREVRAALGRIDTGNFGICLDCEEGISIKRLAAVPWTTSCIVCQEAAENMAGQSRSAAEGLLADVA